MLSPKKLLTYAFATSLLLANLTACGAPEEGENISPSSVTAKDLEGYWYNEETQTLLAFQTAKDAYWDTFTWFNEVYEKPISTAWYLHALPSGGGGTPDVRQASTWSVSNGKINQTVLAEANIFYGDKGTQYSTEIKSFRNQHSMTLESGKTFTYGETCADHVAPGRFSFRGTVDYGSEGNQTCSGTYFVGYAALGVDPKGGVHSVTTVADNNFSLRGTSNPPCAPLASSWDGGCDARRWPTEYSDAQALTVDPDTMTVHSIHSVDVDGEPAKVIYRIRTIGDGKDVEPFTVIDPLPGSKQVKMLVHARGETGTVVIDNKIFRRNGRTFTEVTPTLPTLPQPFSLGEGTIGADGRIYTMSSIDLIFETDEPGVFDTLPLPRNNRHNGLGFSIAVASDGTVHTTYPYEIATNSHGVVFGGIGIYARYDGTTWHEIDLGPIGRSQLALTESGQPIVLHATAKGSNVTYFLSRITPDNKIETRHVIHGTIEGGTLDNWTEPALAVGGGRVAYTTQGIYIGVARLDALFAPHKKDDPTTPITFTFEGNGKARITSDNGLLDCTETCTVELPLNHVIYAKVTPNPGTILPYMPLTDGSFNLRIPVGTEPQTIKIHTAASVTGRIIGIAHRTRGEDTIIMATDDTRTAMLVRSPDTDFHYNTTTLTAPAASPHNVYILTGTIDTPTKLRAVKLNLDQNPILARLTSSGGLELVYVLEQQRTIGDTTVGANGRSTIVRVIITDEGVINTPEILMEFPTITSALAATGDATGTQAILIAAHNPLTPPETSRRAVVTIDANNATLHTFDDKIIGDAPVNTYKTAHQIHVSGKTILATTDGLLAYFADGTKRWETKSSGMILGIDATGTAPTILTSRPGTAANSRDPNAQLKTLDPATGATKTETNLQIPAVGDLMILNANPETGFILWRRHITQTNRRVDIQVFTPNTDEIFWDGGFDIRNITRTSDGRTWLEARITYNAGHPSFQGRDITERQTFLIEMNATP